MINPGAKGAMEHQGFFADVQGLQSLKSGDAAHTKAGLEKVAKEFESIYLKMMMDSMRKAEDVWADDSPLSSQEQSMFRDMLDGQYAKDLSSSGSLGIADMLVKQLSPFVKDGAPSEQTHQDKTQLHKAQEFKINQSAPTQDLSLKPKPLIAINNSAASVQAAPVPFYNAVQHSTLLQQNSAPVQQNTALQQTETAGFIPGDPDSFIATMMPYAESAAAQLGIDPKLLVAQAALETGWGKTLGNNDHGFNMFGIKKSSDWSGQVLTQSTQEFENGRFVNQTADFKAYSSPAESFDDYVQLIQSRYNTSPSMLPEHYVQRLSQGGYATDPAYAEKIMSIYNSDRFSQYSSSVSKASAANVTFALNSYEANASAAQADVTKIW